MNIEQYELSTYIGLHLKAACPVVATTGQPLSAQAEMTAEPVPATSWVWLANQAEVQEEVTPRENEEKEEVAIITGITIITITMTIITVLLNVPSPSRSEKSLVGVKRVYQVYFFQVQVILLPVFLTLIYSVSLSRYYLI